LRAAEGICGCDATTPIQSLDRRRVTCLLLCHHQVHAEATVRCIRGRRRAHLPRQSDSSPSKYDHRGQYEAAPPARIPQHPAPPRPLPPTERGSCVRAAATSPRLVSPHARPLVSARHPPRRQQERSKPQAAPTPRAGAPRTTRVLRVTAAPALPRVGRVVHVAALRGQAVTGRGGCERRTQLAACSGAVLGWVCVQ
jgi:hypothetical protein